MLCFDVRKNRKSVALAGVRESGVLSLILSWRGLEAGASARAAAAKGPIPELYLRVGGIDSSDPAGDRNVEWIGRHCLTLGDRVEVRLVSADAVDAPIRSEPHEPASRRVGDVQCSFCGCMRRTEPRPALLSGVAGASVFICTRCIVFGERLLEQGASHLFHLTREADQTCSFCLAEHRRETIAARGAHMCRSCVEMTMTDGG